VEGFENEAIGVFKTKSLSAVLERILKIIEKV